MKATGIVRRIDDLGRVVIPKEIRRTLRIREGDPLEIFTAADGEVIFKKYSPIGELTQFAQQYAEVLHKATDMTVLISDRDHIIAASGSLKRESLDRRVSKELEAIMDARTSYAASPELDAIMPVLGGESAAAAIFPIIGSGDVSGAVILMCSDNASKPSATEVKRISVAAAFLGKQRNNRKQARSMNGLVI